MYWWIPIAVLLVHQIRKCRFPYSLTPFSKSFFFLILHCLYANLKCFQCQEAYTFFCFSLNFHQKKTCISQLCLFELYCNNCAHIVRPTPCFTYLVVLNVSLCTAFHYPIAYCLLLLLWGNTKPAMSKYNLHERFISLLSNVR